MNKVTNCPSRGAPLDWREQLSGGDSGWSGWRERRYTTYGFALAEALDTDAEYERRRPARNANLESDVAAPGIQAAVSGLIAGIGRGGIAAALGAAHPWAIGLGVGAGALGVAWFVLLRDQRALLWEVETLTGADLDRNGVVGKPEQSPTVRVEIEERKPKGRGSLSFVHLPCTPEQLETLARGALNGKPLSESAWTRKGRPFSRREFSKVRDELVERGLVRWVNPAAHAQGLELTLTGRAVFRRIVEAPPRPTLKCTHAQTG